MDKNEILSKLNIKRFYLDAIPSLKNNGKNQALVCCVFHDDHNPSLSLNLETGVWNCHAGCGSGDIFSFYRKWKGVDFRTALKELAKMAGLTMKMKKQIIATYSYTDEHGNDLYQIVRYTPKDFRPRRKGSNGQWIYNLNGIRRVLYNLPEVLKAEWVIVVEGEKDVDNLKSLGFSGTVAVTTNQGGAKGWRSEYAEFLLGKLVAIIPDNDVPGLEHAEIIAKTLQGKAKAIKIIELPGLGNRQNKHGKDISDWINLKRKEDTPC